MMSRGGKIYYGAPCYLMVVSKKGADSPVDAGILCQNVCLAAESLGLGSVIVGMMRMAFAGGKAGDFRSRLGIGEGYEVNIGVLVGEPAQRAAAHEPDKSKLRFVK
jgi:nitroreductase